MSPGYWACISPLSAYAISDLDHCVDFLFPNTLGAIIYDKIYFTKPQYITHKQLSQVSHHVLFILRAEVAFV